MKKEEISDNLTTRLLRQIDELPKPALIHSATGMRAGGMADVHMATRQALSADEVVACARKKGFDGNAELRLPKLCSRHVDAHPASRAVAALNVARRADKTHVRRWSSGKWSWNRAELRVGSSNQSRAASGFSHFSR